MSVVVPSRQLQEEVGYVCPIPGCTSPYLEWHHFDPPWRVEKHHRPKGMIALCSHHHPVGDVETYTSEQLHEYKAAAAKRAATAAGEFEWRRRKLLLVVGGVYFWALISVGFQRAERRAAPKPPRQAMCLPVAPASIADPRGDRPAIPA